MSEVAKRSPVNKLARLARLAEARLGRPSNKKRWGTLVEAAKNANVKKLLSRSRSDESLSSENANDNSGEPEEKSSATISVEEATQTTPLVGILRISSEEAKRKEANAKSNFGSNITTLPLDPSALANQHKSVKSFVSRVRSRKSKQTAVSFECPIEEGNEESDEHRGGVTSPVELALSENQEDQTEEKTESSKNSFELLSYSKSPSVESDTSADSTQRTSNSPKLERCSISTTSIRILKSPPLAEVQLLISSKQMKVSTPSDASTTTETSSSSSSSQTSSVNTTYPVVSQASSELKIGHVASDQSESVNLENSTSETKTNNGANTYEPRHLPGIQPISRNMSAGWL